METFFHLITSKTFITSVLTPLVTGSLAAALVGYLKADRLRCKKLVAEAYKTALARAEMVYRIRRRSADPALRAQDELAIRDEMHRIQEQTDYYLGLMAIESRWFSKSYNKFVRAVISETWPLLQEAWERDPVGPGVRLESDKHPNLADAKREFLHDAAHFFNPIMRMWRRIRDRG